MALTKGEMEAKIEALEDRVSLLSQTTDHLEQQIEQAADRWVEWVVGLRGALATIARQIDQVRKNVPVPRR